MSYNFVFVGKKCCDSLSFQWCASIYFLMKCFTLCPLVTLVFKIHIWITVHWHVYYLFSTSKGIASFHFGLANNFQLDVTVYRQKGWDFELVLKLRNALRTELQKASLVFPWSPKARVKYSAQHGMRKLQISDVQRLTFFNFSCLNLTIF